MKLLYLKNLLLVSLIFCNFLFAKEVWQDHDHVVVVPKDWQPYYALDENGRPSGFAVEFFDLIAQNLKLKYSYKVADNWDEVFLLLEKGEAHIIPNIGISKSRENFLLFTTPTDTFEISLFKRVTSKDINGIEDILTKNIGLVHANVAFTKFTDEYPKSKITVYDNHFQAIHGLLSGEIEALIYPKAMVIDTLKDLNIDDKIVPFGKNYMEVIRAMGISKQHSRMYEPLNKAIEDFKKTKEYLILYEKWFGKAKTFEFTKEQILLLVFIITTLVLAIVFLIFRNKSLITQKQLQLQLDIRTNDLKQTKDYLQYIFDLNPNILFTTNGTKLITCNKRFLDFVNYANKEEFFRDHECICDFFEKREGYLSKYLRDGQLWIDYIKNNPDKIHKAVIIKNNIEYIFELNLQMLAGGEYLMLLHDISILEKVKIDLQRSNEDLQQFAYIASHDLQEPLRMVSSYLQLIERRYKDKLDQDGLDFIEFAVDGAKRMQALINGLLLFSRVQTKGLPFEKVNMNDVLNDVIDDLSLSIKEKNAEIVVAEDLPFVRADKHQMVQLFENLIGNSLKYSKNEPKVEIGFKKYGEKIIFFVKDNGIGIDNQYFDKIFLIFQRLHSKQSEYEGTGIGLAVCNRIVQRHNGKIWLESTPGEGTTFYLSFPKKEY